jgi:hypothetical protein
MKKPDRSAEGKLYRERKAAKGVKIHTFLLPIALIPEIKTLIKERMAKA